MPLKYLCAICLSVCLALPVSAAAQGLFAPAITVNDQVITGYELDQRARMLTLLNWPEFAT